jgi:hypothetical protein
MHARPADKQKLNAELDQLAARLEAVRVEAKRVTAKREATERRLDEIGRQISGLKTELEAQAAEKPRPKE